MSSSLLLSSLSLGVVVVVCCRRKLALFRKCTHIRPATTVSAIQNCNKQTQIYGDGGPVGRSVDDRTSLRKKLSKPHPSSPSRVARTMVETKYFSIKNVIRGIRKKSYIYNLLTGVGFKLCNRKLTFVATVTKV